MKKLLIAAALAFAPAAVSAEPAPASPAPARTTTIDADPALWVVRDEDTTIYLFGTFHLLDARPWFNDEVRTAFDASSELVVEAIIPDDPAQLQPLVQRYALDAQGRRLSQRLTAEENAALGRALASAGAPATAFDPFEPWFVSMTLGAIAGQRLGISAERGPERVLMHAAHARNMPVTELESVEWQLRLFDDMPDEQQLAQLRQSLRELDMLGQALAPMLAAWSTGDVDGLVRIINAYGAEDPALHRLLFTTRNATWAGWIQQRLERPGTVFVAVGAGHLAGSDSVQAALQARGVASERVPHVEAAAPTS
ncbi:MAG TPA: TraB/GumN family protein [Allosphingosinicella sp.]|jgi:hypothetical protein|nr:TraB/GumN family protein [Allosphingosinicella sp.]